MDKFNVYDSLVNLLAAELDSNADMTDADADGYLEAQGVFVPHVRERMIRDAKMKITIVD